MKQKIKQAIKLYLKNFTPLYDEEKVDISNIVWGLFVLFFLPILLPIAAILYLISFPFKLLANWLNKK